MSASEIDGVDPMEYATRRGLVQRGALRVGPSPCLLQADCPCNVVPCMRSDALARAHDFTSHSHCPPLSPSIRSLHHPSIPVP